MRERENSERDNSEREIIEREWRKRNPGMDIEMDDYGELLEVGEDIGIIK